MIALCTARLTIRNFCADDGESLVEMILPYQSSSVAVYDGKWPTDPEEIKGVAEWFAESDRFLAVCLKEPDRLIGFVSLTPKDGGPGEYGFGYIFDFCFHGRGYATEACRAVLAHASDAMQAETITTGTAAANRPSVRLLKRLGFQKVGEGTSSFWETEEGEPIEFLGYSYALSLDEWQSRVSGFEPS